MLSLKWAIPEKIKEGGGRDRFEETPEILSLSLEIPDKTKLHSWKFHKIVLPRLGSSMTKNQDPRKFHMIFSYHPQKVQFFFI